MSWIGEVTVAVCAVIATGGATAYLLITRMVTKLHELDRAGKKSREVESGLKALERRLTDLQDIVISLDERLGRLEAGGARSREFAPVEKGG